MESILGLVLFLMRTAKVPGHAVLKTELKGGGSFVLWRGHVFREQCRGRLDSAPSSSVLGHLGPPSSAWPDGSDWAVGYFPEAAVLISEQ